MSGKPLSLMCPCGKKLAEYPYLGRPQPDRRALGVPANVRYQAGRWTPEDSESFGPWPDDDQPVDPGTPGAIDDELVAWLDDLAAQAPPADQAVSLPEPGPVFALKCSRCRQVHLVFQEPLDVEVERLGAIGRVHYARSDKRHERWTYRVSPSTKGTDPVPVLRFNKPS